MKTWLTDPNPAGLFVFLALLSLCSAVALVCSSPPVPDPDGGASLHEPSSIDWGQYTYTNTLADDVPKTEMLTEADIERKKLIGRIAQGIHRVRTTRGQVPFWFCGEPYTGEAAVDLAIEVAWHIVVESEKNKLNPWGVAGLASNESGFDLCSLGTYPRLAAYDLGILKRKKLTLSHSREEIERSISDPRMVSKFRAYDLGLLQTLDIYYRRDRRYQGERGRAKDLITWEGFSWQVGHLRRLGERHHTHEPWLYWPGYRAEWKREKVRRFAKQLGATSDDMERKKR